MFKVIMALVFINSVSFLYPAAKEQKELVSELIQKFQKYHEVFPREKVYLQLNKSVFKPREDLWFKGYIVETLQHRPSEMSRDLTIKLIDETGLTVFQDHFAIENGFVYGNFKIPKSIEEGIYTLVGYSNWMQNGPAADVFHQQIGIVHSLLPKFFIHVSLNDSLYSSKESIRAVIHTQSRKKKPIANLKIEYEIRTVDESINKGTQKTDKNGIAEIRFALPPQLKSRLVFLTIRAKNEMEEEARTIQIPIQKEKVQMAFFPEGGCLINGIHTRIAFKAMDEIMNPVDISGVVKNQKGDMITNLKADQHGMGTFSFTPSVQDSYIVELNDPYDGEQKHALPEVMESGISVSMDSLNRNIIFCKVKSSSPNDQKIFVITRVGGTIRWVSNVMVQDSTLFHISVQQFPMGIAQITVLDSTLTTLAERLVFINDHKQADARIQLNKNRYQQKEETVVSVQVTDEMHIPVPMELSLSILPEHRLFLNKTPHILSTFLLTSELKHGIIDPNYYFDEPFLSVDAIDLMLMTNQCKTVSWNKILKFNENDLSDISKGAVSGFVYDKYKMPVADMKVQLTTKDKKVFETATNSKGVYCFLSDGSSVLDVGKITPRVKVKSEDIHAVIEHNFDEEVNRFFTADSHERIRNAIELDRYQYRLNWQEENLPAEANYIDRRFSNSIKVLPTEEKVPPWKRHIAEVGVLEAIRMIKPYQLINGKIVFHGVSSFQSTYGALFVLDNVKLGTDPQVANYINPHDVEDIQVHTAPIDILRFDSFAVDGVIEITTKSGGRQQRGRKDIDRLTMKDPYWIPRLMLDHNGRVEFSYYNPRQKLSMMGIVEGMSEEGKIVRGTFQYDIE